MGTDAKILKTVMRIIRIKVLRDNLIEVREKYEKLYGDEYPMEVFGHHKQEFDSEKPEYFECVIENGIYIYQLISIYLD
jgi:hypothetical protein